MKEFTLLRSEIKKAIKKANELNGCKDCTVTGYSYNEKADDYGFISVRCEICHNYEERAEYDVTVECFLRDRRMSWARA